MSDPITRRSFAALAATALGSATDLAAADDKPQPPTGPLEAAFRAATTRRRASNPPGRNHRSIGCSSRIS